MTSSTDSQKPPHPNTCVHSSPRDESVSATRAGVASIEQADAKKRPADPHFGAVSLALYRDIVECCADAIIVVDAQQKITFANPAAAEMFETSRAELIGQPLDILLPPAVRAQHRQHVEGFQTSGPTAQYMGRRTSSLCGMRRSGEEFPVAISILKTHDQLGPHLVAVIRDITERTNLEQDLKSLASTDPLTGILNRRAFMLRAEEERARSLRAGHRLALAMIDADHFKRINDEFGHATGDEALKRIAHTVVARLRKSDVFGRWGGEEFALLLPETDQNGAIMIAERLRYAIEKEGMNTGGKTGRISLTVSIGVAEYAPEQNSIDALIRLADQALYEAKLKGRNRVATASASESSAA